MNTKSNNNITKIDLTKEKGEYYILFKTPENKTKKIEHLAELELTRTNKETLTLKITSKNPTKTTLYHYINDQAGLLEDLDVSLM